eukprot:292808_1
MLALLLSLLAAHPLLIVSTLNWVQITDNAPWTNRSSFTAVTYKSTIVISGGYPNITSIWNSSSNVLNWSQDTKSTGMSIRTAITTVQLNNNIISMGGCNGHDSRFNDVWLSNDGGHTWKEITSSASWSARCCHASIAYNGSILVLGGHDMNDYKNDVWISNDNGLTWNIVTNNAEWSPRDALTATVLNNKIFIMGGHDGSQGPSQFHNDVWSSSDGGKTWIQMTSNAQWNRRSALQAVTWNNNIVIMGGCGSAIGDVCDKFFNDVWMSSDGSSWKQINTAEIWSRRCWFATTTLNNSIYVLGGDSATIAAMSDVWVLKE